MAGDDTKVSRTRGPGRSGRQERARGAQPARVPKRRVPRQERARRTVAWILEAAGELFAELGYSGATTNKIAARAGVSVGSLYQYFPDKDALVAALLEAHREQIHGVVEEAMAQLADPEVPLDSALRSLFDGLVDVHAKNPDLHRELGEAARRQERDQSEEEHYAREVERILRARPEVTMEDPGLVAILVVRTVESLSRWLGHEAPADLSRPAFVDECVSMLTGYLTSRVRARIPDVNSV